MRITVTMSPTSHNEATVVCVPNWLERLVLGEVPREFTALRSADIGPLHRWWDDDRRRYVKSSQIVEALDRAWWSADRDHTDEIRPALFRARERAAREHS